MVCSIQTPQDCVDSDLVSANYHPNCSLQLVSTADMWQHLWCSCYGFSCNCIPFCHISTAHSHNKFFPQVFIQNPTQFCKYLRFVIGSWIVGNSVNIANVIPQLWRPDQDHSPLINVSHTSQCNQSTNNTKVDTDNPQLVAISDDEGVNPTGNRTANPMVNPTVDPTAGPDSIYDPTVESTANPTVNLPVDPTAGSTAKPTTDWTDDPTGNHVQDKCFVSPTKKSATTKPTKDKKFKCSHCSVLFSRKFSLP